MLVRSAMIVWAMAATVLPVAPAPAAETAPGGEPPAIENVEPYVAAAPAPAVPVEGAPVYARPVGLFYRLDDAPAPEARPDGLRFDFVQLPAPATSFRRSPALGAPRSGWAFSGRAGVLRWLTPIDGEGGTTVRLSGRIPDQPRAPGLGIFNMSLHYAFE